MADPLGLIGGGGGGGVVGLGPAGSGVRGVDRVGRVAGGPGGAAGAGDAAEGSFASELLKSIEQVNGLEQQANEATEDLLSGRRNDVENVILATQKADAAFRLLLSVRNKVVQAYDELKQVRI
ncbi:MAG: flagellar hook-basal body complex protein FliE [Planctomyces sp.]|nr:flagellar hook-basal body complex protein FliE [Planctomyces sp.]